MAGFDVRVRGLGPPYAPPPGAEVLLLEGVGHEALAPILEALVADPGGRSNATFRCGSALVELRAGAGHLVIDRPSGPHPLPVEQALEVLERVASASAPPLPDPAPPAPGWQSLAVLLLASALGTAVILSTLF